MEPPVDSPVYRESVERPDLLSERSPDGVKITQITADPTRACSHIYMEAHVFTPDSKRFVFQQVRNPNEMDPRAMSRHYMLCDLDDCSFVRITDEDGAIAPSVSPDGTFLYYFIDQTHVGGGGWWSVRRLDLATLKRETIARFDGPIPGMHRHFSRIYVLSSISSDGTRVCTSGYLGDGHTRNEPWGLIVFDIEKATAELVLAGESFCNLHPQYCRSKNPEACRDILVQENHGCDVDEQGNITTLISGRGADIHVIRDDGTRFRSMPWGRDGMEYCQGHQAWRGERLSAVTSVILTGTDRYPLIESLPITAKEEQAHQGVRIPGGARNRISRSMKREDSCHFAYDPTGTLFVSDTFGYQGRQGDCEIYIGTLPDGADAELQTRHLLYPRASFGDSQHTHPHPFQSPDGTKVFFNSDVTGVPQIYMADGCR